MGKTNLFWRTDYQIRANKLGVVGSDGKMVGEMSRDEAIKMAKDAGLSLVEIAPNAVPPVAKIVDFGKFKYSEEKKLKKQSKGSRGGELKEIRFSPFIADNDYNTRLSRVKEFLKEKNKVKVVVVFLGRQMGSKRFGFELIKKIESELGDNIAVDMPPKFLGRHLVTIISPVVGKKQDNVKTEDKKINN